MMNTKARAPFSLQNLDGNGRFSGYASVFNTVDSQGDSIAPGAFQQSLEVWRLRKRWPSLLWQHDLHNPIGVIERMVEDDYGLKIQAVLLLDASLARDAYALLKGGAIDSLSIGYVPVDVVKDKASGIRTITSMTLWEVSLVTFPANPLARISDVKADDDGVQAMLDSMRKLTATLCGTIPHTKNNPHPAPLP